MEKYSAYRDAGTGIQPFLNPVAPATENKALKTLLQPVGYLVGCVRLVLCMIVLLLYFLLVKGVCLILLPIGPLYVALKRALTSLLVRLALLILGFFWIPVSTTPRKRGRIIRNALNEKWDPKAGDLIVSNWVSWIEVLWLAFRFDPVFVLPIATPPEFSPKGPQIPQRATGRKTGTGSANISTPSFVTNEPRAHAPIVGFEEVSFLRMLSVVGRVPPFSPDVSKNSRSLDEIRRSSQRPVVVFPECSTSNGRALLRFASVFPKAAGVPVKGYRIFVMCVRYDAPTVLSPSLTLSLPPAKSYLPSTVSHLFSISTALSLSRPISIRLLPPSESPSAPAFMVSEVASGNVPEHDMLREVCETLVASMGKIKRTQLGWEDKAGLMKMYYL